MPMYEILILEFPDNLLIKQYLLQHSLKCKDLSNINKLLAIINAAQLVLSSINHGEVAMNLGMNIDKEDTVEVESRKKFELKKTAIIDAYSAIGITTLDLINLTISNTNRSTSTIPIDTSSNLNASLSSTISIDSNNSNIGLIDACYTDIALLEASFAKLIKDLSKWDSIHSDKHWLLALNMYKSKLQHGEALKLINELFLKVTENNIKIDNLSKELLIKERNLVLKELKWYYILENKKKWDKLHAKKEYNPF